MFSVVLECRPCISFQCLVLECKPCISPPGRVRPEGRAPIADAVAAMPGAPTGGAVLFAAVLAAVAER